MNGQFISTLRRFGRDELLAMFINVIGTGLISLVVTSALILAIIGPIIEKIGFFPAHFKDAFDKKNSKKESMKKGFKEGLVSLGEDLLVHDPIYMGLMFLGLNLFNIPSWFLSGSSFAIPSHAHR